MVGVVVMPMAFFSVLLMPFGLEALPLTVMGWGLDWILVVARTTAAWSHDWGGVPMAPAGALLLVVSGFLWLSIWRERWRFLGLLPLVAAIPAAALAPRPDILIAESGTTVAIRGEDGLYRIVGLKANRFAVETWLRADADTRPVSSALEDGTRCDPIGCVATLHDGTTVAVGLKPEAFADDCRMADLVISRFTAPDFCDEAATVIDSTDLRTGGAHALYRLPQKGEESGFRVEAAYPPNRRAFMPPTRQ